MNEVPPDRRVYSEGNLPHRADADAETQRAGGPGGDVSCYPGGRPPRARQEGCPAAEGPRRSPLQWVIVAQQRRSMKQVPADSAASLLAGTGRTAARN